MQHELENAVVELTAPDGTVYRFRYGATIPYAGQDYVVLLEMEDAPSGEEQILVTRLEEAGDGQLSFVVAEEEDVIQQVFDKYVALTLNRAVEGLEDTDCGCGCHHHHEEDGCCGHHHQHGNDCGCGHHHDEDSGCGCGCHH